MKSLSHYQEITVLDCETTGLDYQNNHIIELAACRFVFDGNHYVINDQMDVLIKIKYPLPSVITNLTGITEAMLEEQGVEESEAVNQFFQRFINASTNQKLVAAYNAPFDINFIRVMLARYGKSFKGADFLDILTVYKDRAPFPHKLKDALTYYHLNDRVVNSHRAIDDCLACYEVLLTMGNELDDLDQYVNLFGYNPKYPPKDKVDGVLYAPQFYGSKTKLYE